MATYDNNLRITEITPGDEDGTWGGTLNDQLDLIGDALGYSTQDGFSSDANATTTVADGAADPARALYYKVTSSATLTATRTLTIAPNTISRVMLIENSTTGGQSIAISQGSGGNVTIANGETKMVYLDGAGSGAAVVDALASINLSTSADITTSGDVTLTDGKLSITQSAADDAIFIDQNGNGIALNIDSEATTANVISAAADALTSGHGANISCGSSTFSGVLFRANVSSGSATGKGIEVINAGTGNGVFIDQNGNGIALNIDSEATGSAAVTINSLRSANYAFELTCSDATSPVGIKVDFSAAMPNGAGNYFLYCEDSTTSRFQLRSNGGLANYQANDANLSDERVKDILGLEESQWDNVKAWEITRFRYKDQHGEGKIHTGLIAQQIQQYDPDLIDDTGWGDKDYLAIYDKDAQYKVVKALQESMVRIEQLENEVNTLKGA